MSCAKFLLLTLFLLFNSTTGFSTIGLAESREVICGEFIVTNSDSDQALFGDSNGTILMRHKELLLPWVMDVTDRRGFIIGTTGPDLVDSTREFFTLDTGTMEIHHYRDAESFNRELDRLDLIQFPQQLFLDTRTNFFEQSFKLDLIRFVFWELVLLTVLMPIVIAVRNRSREQQRN